MSFKDKLDLKKVPQHVAIIMDGNGRWARQRNKDRIFGHREGVKSAKEVVEAAGEIGVKYLTLYAFSSENWQRPEHEVKALMQLLVQEITEELDRFKKENLQLKVIGDLSRLDQDVYNAVQKAIDETSNNTGMTIIIALSYGSRQEIVNAVRQIAQKVKEGRLEVSQINEQVFANHLYTAGIPDPDFLIRTSGELRISNFLLWQLSYTELYFTKVLWPDFRKEQFFEAIYNFQQRERRYGKTSEQLEN